MGRESRRPAALDVSSAKPGGIGWPTCSNEPIRKRVWLMGKRRRGCQKKITAPPDCTGGRVVFNSPGILSSDLSLHMGLKGVDCEVGGYKNLGEKCSNCLVSL